ncbi:Hypothetical predicted protein [Mytilus galloprovincialis]|uniref:Uncharacterized protein n=1 Tax=Mytilus galloprovincialis TaxID=29158 RepID=A0A8B6GVM8_MYTGA|nr:Hypothetical predicted protein [Mytilus galloprovincialis]
MAFKGLHSVLEKAMKEQLPGGRYFEPTEELREQSKSVIPHNKIPERVFGMLDFFLRYRPNASTISNEAFLMFVFNKTSEWLDSLPQEEKEKLLTDSIKEGRNIRAKYQKRLAQITEARKQKLKDKQIALEKKQKAALKTKSKHTCNIIYFGLWQKTDQVNAILDEIEGLIVDAGDGPGEERSSRNIPLFVGKRVSHAFNDGKWKGHVISVVKGFPDFYNIVYDTDMTDVGDTSSASAIYTYKLKEDYRNGNLEIIPEVDTEDN